MRFAPPLFFFSFSFEVSFLTFLKGFGREKTKAIHCEQRKVKCAQSERNDYENSFEQQRDRQIDRAKNTPEIIGIFAEYERNCVPTSTCQ